MISGRFWTIPNILSLSRLALIPLWWMFMSSPNRMLWWWGGVLIAYAIASDVLDGYIARRFNQVSDWGKLLDPVGDKVAAAATAVFCVIHRDMPWAALAITVGRDLTLVGAGWIVMKRYLAIPTSLNIGRYAALFWGLTILLYTFDWQPYAGYLVWPAVALYVAAGIAYVIKRRTLLTAGSTGIL
ncbi:MAG: CDP-diacylglycerol--glycerol-3-phosphate 3-phosphatidyltransferase [Candidatus Zixiibacteriota bacterium]